MILMQEFKGYIFKIMGGQDKQGFPMKQGVLTNGRVRLLLSPGDKCFRGYGRRKGERRRKSVRGCVISQDISVLNLVIVKRGVPPAVKAQPQSAASTRPNMRELALHTSFANRVASLRQGSSNSMHWIG
jgi:hypothetical protein